MKKLCVASLTVALLLAAPQPIHAQREDATPAAQGLAKLKALEGEWMDVDGAFGTKGAVAITYRVTSGGKAVIETFPVNTAFEMVTVYHLDGNDLVLTHYCSGGTQPRMRSKGLDGNTLAFDSTAGPTSMSRRPATCTRQESSSSPPTRSAPPGRTGRMESPTIGTGRRSGPFASSRKRPALHKRGTHEGPANTAIGRPSHLAGRSLNGDCPLFQLLPMIRKKKPAPRTWLARHEMGTVPIFIFCRSFAETELDPRPSVPRPAMNGFQI